ncbi:hypothetical protein BBK82_34720 [Lentzea guizhouensis]|uniref:ESX-1 secretion-associated protein n=1 Tax=Lentzea guizhouensis TaxID=1586287 RepID=A0A1B2HRR1_9PSEU|nr:type VII secretion target [Lentzea guizhouensis]ANZ40409.1 hypothetical protein BBK82_34720 [Lentzea guizhouensis]
MREGYTVSAAVLAEQARKVGGLVAELRAAAETAGAVALTPTAFGDAAGEAAAALDRFGTDGLDAVVAALNSLVETGSRLRATADEYERQETDTWSAFGRSRTRRPGRRG